MCKHITNIKVTNLPPSLPLAMLHFSDNFASASTAFCLMELPEELLKQVEANPDVQFRFKGRDDEEAVLVSENKTYAVRRGETSNSQLLFACSAHDLLSSCSENGQDHDSSTRSCEVVFQTGHTLELYLTAPRLKTLPTLLSRCPYDGTPSTEETTSTEMDFSLRPTLEELLVMLQASKAEIQQELRSVGALEVDGRYCLLGARYESNLITLVLAAAMINGWKLTALSLPLLQSEKDLRHYPEFVLVNFLCKFGTQIQDENSLPNAEVSSIAEAHVLAGGAIALDTHKIIMARADELLIALPSNQRLTQEEFLAAWQTMVPPGVSVRLEYLRGRAVVEQKGPSKLVKRFSADALSPDPKTRFRQLFQQCPCWSREDLLAYVSDLVGPGQSGDQLLLKHTRVTRSGTPGKDEVRMYTARI